MNPETPNLLRAARDLAAGRLLAGLGADGHWIGELSSSALSTAVATIALGELDRRGGVDQHRTQVTAGLDWLARNANADGGWGDTTRSRSNLSTTALVWAAFGAASQGAAHAPTVAAAEAWITQAAGSLRNLVAAIEARYGDDRTFSVPIVMTLALSGRLGPDGWSRVRPLPFELAALPRSWFGALQLPVVSYALPALIAIGQAIHFHAPSRNPVARILRRGVARSTLDLLVDLQPVNGGFLEATPLTAFVTMALASMGETRHPVALRAADFLRQSMRPEGSWPIDTNLATWTTTLSIKALALGGPNSHRHNSKDRSALRTWLLEQQFKDIHRYTGAAPGGWAWTDLPGGVPDADDTAGALLALRCMDGDAPPDPATIRAAEAGVRWLLDLQNRDGGIPTFCRGWGRLPFDRSAPELTAHALRAWHAWESFISSPTRSRLADSRRRAGKFLVRSQRTNGSWVPLWFGNEHATGDENAVIGTSLVLLARPAVDPARSDGSCWQRGSRYLLDSQNADGSWGGATQVAGSVEETSLAVSALANDPESRQAAMRGALWVAAKIDANDVDPTPIGLYFARLWYSERLYPWIWATEALSRIQDPAPA